MDHHPANWGNPLSTATAPISHTQQPMVTGTSVLGLKFSKGIMLAADTLASYGSLAQIRDMQRLVPIGDYTAIGAGGDMSDWQAIQVLLDQLVTEEYANDDGISFGPEHLHEYLARVMYERRSKSDPLWNSLVVGGKKHGKSYTLFNDRFLGYVDYQGTTYHSSTIATGYGAYIAQPILRKAVEGKENTLTEQEAEKILNDCMRVLFYRDARSLNKIQRAIIDDDGVRITKPYSLDTHWGFADSIRGYGAVYE